MSEWLLATPRPLDGMSTAGDWSGATAATHDDRWPGPRCLLKGSLLRLVALPERLPSWIDPIKARRQRDAQQRMDREVRHAAIVRDDCFGLPTLGG